MLARCLQHEVDHLDGHLFLDRLPDGERRQALRALRTGLAPPGPDGAGRPGGRARSRARRIYRSSLNRPRSRSKAGLGE